MSLRALLRAVRDTIRTAYSLAETGCDVTSDGRPHPDCGELYYAVHPGGLQNSSTLALDERADLLVTVTRRVAYSPVDRLRNEMLDADGLLAKAEALRVLLGMSYSVMDLANSTGTGFIGASANGFVEPLCFRTLTWAGEKGPDWFFADGQDDAPCGLAVQLAFDRARRVQHLDGPAT